MNFLCEFQVRNLSVHEYVSMTLLKDAGVPTPKFGVAKTAAEAKKIASELDTIDLVVKAQASIKQQLDKRKKILLIKPISFRSLPEAVEKDDSPSIPREAYSSFSARRRSRLQRKE